MTTGRRDAFSQRGAALPWLLVLLLLVAAGGAGWFGWQWLNTSAADVDELLVEIDRLTLVQQEQREQYDDQVLLLAERLNGIDRMLEERDRQLQEMQQGGMRQWLVGEAEALASLAGQRLLLTADLAATRRLLEGADATLARISDPQTLTARRALATDIEAVRGAEQVDIPALVLRLAALQELVDELAVPALPVQPQADQALPDDALWWQRLVHSLPIRIQHDEQAAPLPLDATQAALLRLALDGSLQQAQLALMQARPQVYDAALDQADRLIRSRFAGNDSRARHLLASLADLRDQAVHQALPEIGSGLAAIRALKAGQPQ
ncbi:uroporphyrinogen-III C-methyltransferase [Alcanivorax sp. 1008]|nr:uroporphyrinogen-III C-methyltransferase [Alcanivorax sp. 1008]MCC1497411.1 uroporphyrinogen-III C-methyltransferase [Alcanivorax sp. 1008]